MKWKWEQNEKTVDPEVMFFLFLLEQIHDLNHKLTPLLFPPWLLLIRDKDFQANSKGILSTSNCT